jgi:AraC-like DNA-binding protein
MVLAESLGISVLDYRCRVHAHPEGPEEHNESHSIVFVRRGAFRRTRQRESLLADANHVLFFNAGQPYRVSHPLPGGDDCTIVALPTALAVELVARREPRHAERAETPFRFGHAISSTRAACLHWELLARVRGRRPGPSVPAETGAATERHAERSSALLFDREGSGWGRRQTLRVDGHDGGTQGDGVGRLELDDVLAELTEEALRAAYAGQASSLGDAEDASTRTRRRHRDLAEAAKLALHARLAAPPGLAELARALGCSPFHVSRTFRRSAGLSLRRYLARLRTSLAAQRLAEGARDLTQLALQLGYADHSHFTNAFRAEWGVPPSLFRSRNTAPS